MSIRRIRASGSNFLHAEVKICLGYSLLLSPPTSILSNLALIAFLFINTPFPTIGFFMEIPDPVHPLPPSPSALDCHQSYRLMIAQDEVRSPTTFSAGTHLGIVEWGGRGLSGGYKKTVVAIARQPLFPFSTELDHDRGGGNFSGSKPYFFLPS